MGNLLLLITVLSLGATTTFAVIQEAFNVIQEAIQTVDTDGDKVIWLVELKRVANPDTLPDTVMRVIDEDGDGRFTYTEFKDEAEEKDPLNSIHKALGRLDSALNSSSRTAVEWKAYASIIGCGILMSMHL